MRRHDLLWLLLAPAYVIIGTARHELAHAAVAVAQGASITDWSILPATLDGTFFWGYVSWAGGDVTWLTTAAPYIGDLATMGTGLALLPLTANHRWLWVNLVILAIATPLIDSTYQYLRPLTGAGGDVEALLQDLPPLIVHAWFLTVIPLYATALLVILRRGPGSQSKGKS